MHQISKIKLLGPARAYLKKHEKQWSKGWHYKVHLHLRHLRRWLQKEKLNFRNLTPAHIEKFLEEEFSPTKAAEQNTILRSYIRWLVEHNGSQVNFQFLFPDYPRWNPALPLYAQEYLSLKIPQLQSQISKTTVRRVVTRFHRWLRGARMSVKDIKREDLEKFLKDYSRRTPYSAPTLHTFRSFLRLYLDWLVDTRRMEDIDLSIIFPKGKNKSYRTLSTRAKRFLATLPTGREPKTCFQYKAALCGFYSFLHERRIKECHIARKHLEVWMNELQMRGLKPSSRLHYLLKLRSYFTWLNEHGYLKKDSYDLIRIMDLPRRPTLLPRPLPPEIDHEIQSRLAQSDLLLDHGLLLLRRTGIRISELINLPYDCMKRDHSDNWSVKVPLGKMHSERLVPLTDDTVRLIEKIQKKSRDLDPSSPKLMSNRFKSGTLYANLRLALIEVSKDLKTADPIMPHRLRHSLATELLNGGMSLYCLMRLLGHKSSVTTQIYSLVAQKTIRGEYFQAIDKTANRYILRRENKSEDSPIPSPKQALEDSIRWFHKEFAHSADHRKFSLLLKRMHRLKSDLNAFEKSARD